MRRRSDPMNDESKNPEPNVPKPPPSVIGSRRFMFATGIENSYPTIPSADGTTKRVDEMEKTAVDQCVNAKPIDHETRAAMAAEVRAIRKFRQKITGLIEEASAVHTGAPA